jgi:hypothetical protein
MNFGSKAKSVRLGIASLVFCLYAAGSAWVIHIEGLSYRQKLRDDRLVARTDHTPIPETTERIPEVEVSAVPEVRSSTPVETPEPPDSRPTIPPEPKPAPPLPAERTTIVPTGEAPKAAPVSSLDPFWELPEQKKVWDLDHLTVEDEKRLGADLNRMILHDHKPVASGPLPGRLAEAGEPYLPKGISYTFTVLDCDESNVFSHPGGYIYACRGLFDWIAEEEDYALEFIVAHEMGHLEKSHALNCLRDPEIKKLGMGTMPLFYALLIPWGYREEQDFEADRWATQRMRQAGRSRHETMAFLRKFEDFARKHEFEAIRKKPTDDPKLDPLDNHLRAHPLVRTRLKELKKLLDPAAKSR